nr:hypothetical protein [Streptomyces sp. WAC01280]
MLELGYRSEDLEEHPPNCGGGVDAPVEDDEVDPVGLEVLGQLDEVLQRAAEAVELGVEFGAASKLAGHLVCEDLLAAGRAECVLLGFGVLIPVRYAGDADSHVRNVTRTG